jgi:tetratricopeptide (TPR) repeat protein
VLKLDEKNASAMLDLSRAYFAQRKYELARLAVDNARELAPDRGDIYHQLGVLLLHKNERPQALAAFRKATELRPDLAASQINLSQLLSETSDAQGALLAAEAAVAWAPESRNARLALANAYRAAQRFAEAEKAYRELGDDQDALYNLGALYLDTELAGVALEERLTRAIATLSRIKKRTPEIDGYIAQAKRQIEAEKKRLAREAKRKKV